MKLFTLDLSGILLSLVFGAIVFYFQGSGGLLLLLLFLISSAYVTRIGYVEKTEKGIYDYSRTWKNVFSNGIIPVLAATTGNLSAFIASVSAITADKFGSELGVLDPKAYDILSFQRVKPGTDGGISIFGTISSFVGASIITLAAIPLFGITVKKAFFLATAGFIGSLFDSLAGHFERKGIGNKEISNIIGALAAFILGYIMR